MSDDKKKTDFKLDDSTFKGLKTFYNNIKQFTKAMERPAQVLHKRINKPLKVFRDLLKRQREDFDRRYQKYYPAMEKIIEEKKGIVPDNKERMWEIFIFEILENEDVFFRPLEREDFIRFHAIMEQRLKNDFPNIVDSVNEQFTNKKQEPWDRIDPTAKGWINNFLRSKQFSTQREKQAKAFLTTFEILAMEYNPGSLIKQKGQTVEDIKAHESFSIDPGMLPGIRTLRTDWLVKYYEEFRTY